MCMDELAEPVQMASPLSHFDVRFKGYWLLNSRESAGPRNDWSGDEGS